MSGVVDAVGGVVNGVVDTISANPVLGVAAIGAPLLGPGIGAAAASNAIGSAGLASTGLGAAGTAATGLGGMSLAGLGSNAAATAAGNSIFGSGLASIGAPALASTVPGMGAAAGMGIGSAALQSAMPMAQSLGGAGLSGGLSMMDMMGGLNSMSGGQPNPQLRQIQGARSRGGQYQDVYAPPGIGFNQSQPVADRFAGLLG